MKEPFLVMFVVGVLLLLWALKPTKKNTEENRTNGEKQEISIEDISIIWTKRKEAVIRLEELARLWRNFNTTQEQNDIPHFFTPVVREFFEKHINKKPFYTGNVKTVINNLLTLLDTEGNIPSVVSGQNETESKIPENTYKMLAQVSLAEHTIHVAEEILAIVPYGANLPIALISALAHDLGKMPKFRKQYYSLGDHPFISVTVLESIGGFKELVYKDDIMQAVRDHHLKPKGYVGENLKEADTRARRRELMEVQKKLAMSPPPDAFEKSEPNIDIEIPKDNINTENLKEGVVDEVTILMETSTNEIPITTSNPTNSSNQTSTQTLTKQPFTNQTQTPSNFHQTFSSFTPSATKIDKPEKSDKFDTSYIEPDKADEPDDIPAIFNYQPAKIKKPEPETTVADIFINTQTETPTEEEQKPEEIPMPWFNPEEFLSKILPYVNKIINGRWSAVSMPNGVVYIQPRLFWNVLTEMAAEKGITELVYYENDKTMKRNCIYTVLNQIQQHKNAVESSLIKKGYFSAPFIVKMKSGDTSRVLYIPLKAQEAFGISVGELEARKEGKVRDIEDIYPPYKEID
jgi:hypothetical protein